jgi:hypothetical protein
MAHARCATKAQNGAPQIGFLLVVFALCFVTLRGVFMHFPELTLSMDFVSQEHGVPRDGPKDSNAGG